MKRVLGVLLLALILVSPILVLAQGTETLGQGKEALSEGKEALSGVTKELSQAKKDSFEEPPKSSVPSEPLNLPNSIQTLLRLSFRIEGEDLTFHYLILTLFIWIFVLIHIIEFMGISPLQPLANILISLIITLIAGTTGIFFKASKLILGELAKLSLLNSLIIIIAFTILAFILKFVSKKLKKSSRIEEAAKAGKEAHRVNVINEAKLKTGVA